MNAKQCPVDGEKCDGCAGVRDPCEDAPDNEDALSAPEGLDGGGDLDMPGLTPKRTKAGNARPTGPGPCPKCAGPTRFIPDGKRGPFHGCLAHPACKGTRGADEDDATEKTLYADAWKTNRRMPKELESP